VSAEIKLELLGLIDQAVADGWAHARACRVLDLADSRDNERSHRPCRHDRSTPQAIAR